MKLALTTAYLLLIIMPAGLLGRHRALPGEGQATNQADKCDDVTAQVRKLDLNGKRGSVCFKHKTHEAYLNPDLQTPHKAEAGAACIGCHHRATAVTGVPILTKCASCHAWQGNPENPKNIEHDEMWSERAFHDLCIGCHRASNAKGITQNKAPVACGDCHSFKVMDSRAEAVPGSPINLGQLDGSAAMIAPKR